MKKKIFLFCVLMLGFLTNLPINKEAFLSVPVLAEEEQTVTICGKTFEMPCIVLVGSYDYQADEAVVSWTRKDSSTYINYGPEFTISDQKSFDDFMFYMRKYCYCGFSEEAIDAHGSDGLTDTFIMILKNPGKYNSGDLLDDNTLSGLKQCSDFIDVLNCNGEPFNDAWLLKDESPVISGIDYIYLTNIDSPDKEELIRHCLKAIDDVDGDITSRIVLKEDNYTGKTLSLNNLYTITYEVSDSALNTSSLTIYVQPVDITSPIISGPISFTSYTSSPITTDDILDQLVVYDNVDKDFTDKIVVTKDTFTENKNIPGQYEVKFSTADSSGNNATKTVVITVVDDIKPSISGNNHYTKSRKTNLTIKTIMEGLVATDNIDGNISNLITVKADGYTNHQFDVGEFNIVFSVKDQSLNESEDFVVTIKIEDNVLPIFYVSNRIINIEETETLSHEEIISFLLNTKSIKPNYKSVRFISDDYSENKNEIGEHAVILKVTYDDESSETINISINVFDSEESEHSEVELPTVNEKGTFKMFLQKLSAFFTNFGLKIANFFKNLFNI